MLRPPLLARPDLASRALEGRVRAARYAATTPMQAVAPSIPLRAAGHPEADPRGALLFGEVFDVLERLDGWAWGQARRDGVVGWAPLGALVAAVLLPTHVVTAETAETRDAPDADVAGDVYAFNALVTEDARQGDWVHVVRAGWFQAGDLGPLEAARQPEFAES